MSPVGPRLPAPHTTAKAKAGARHENRRDSRSVRNTPQSRLPRLVALCIGAVLSSDCQPQSAEKAFSERLAGTGIAPQQVARFSRPTLELTSEALLIKGTGHSAGLLVHYLVDPTRGYRVRIHGRSLEGTVSLRLRVNEEDASYAEAPQGVARVEVVEGARSIELLFYSDNPFRYRLETIVVQKCDPCADDERLADQLLSEIPELGRTLDDDRLAAARLLLDWASNASDWALTPDLERDASTAVLLNGPASVYHEVYAPDLGGSYCGGVADFFNKVLRLFGYDSFAMHFGHGWGDLTHAVVLVPQRVGGEWRYFVFDPTFNLTWRHKKDFAWASYRDLVAAQAAGEPLPVVPEVRSLADRDFHAPKSQPELCPVLKRETEKALICSQPEFGLDFYLNSIAPTLRDYGYRPELHGLLQLMANQVFIAARSPEPEIHQHFLERLRSLGVPYND